MDIMEIIKAILFGIVEGITEWLPISSTGHMILLNEFVTLNVSAEFWEMFLVVIQLGAILAVVLLYWNKIFPFHFKEKPVVQKDIFVLWFKILVACIPAAVIGLAFDDVFDALFYNPWCVAIALIVFGIAFIVIENHNKNAKPKITQLSQITYKTALIIGVFQLLAAIFPGTSSRRVYLFPGYSGYARSKSFEAGEVRIQLYRTGGSDPVSGHGGSFCGFHCGNPIPYGIYQKT